ncbi:quinoprotein relay system zinc metallohydrolase 2 [Labrys okinawensis]|uniref:Quinoprotein relay system zinc metallohydrolase 2 n=1 Tax=Labrys okinawensis TaxID=346911 RepID=A0A2S9Q8S4_9HYPH|nr:quinoprotein relay system zinc metallohydrolase 2 [Labrys okinawensis]PRH85749.1 quinoprotein relay system zinc metallohydrolase 2 [Labrys okinawensis]
MQRLVMLARLWITACLILLPGFASAETLPMPLPMTEVAEGVFVFAAPYELAAPGNADAIGNAGFVIGSEAVAVVDTGGSRQAGLALLAAIRARTDKPIRYVVDTHVHPDHLLGNAAFRLPGVTIVGHANLPEALSARAGTYLSATRRLIGEAAFAGTEAIAPTLLVKDRLTLDLGGRTLLLEAWPTAHTNTDLTVLDEKTGTWFLGDLLFAGHVPALDGSLKGWIAVIDALRSRPAARVVPGHGPAAMPWPAAADPIRRYLVRLRDDVRAMIAEGRTLREAAERAGQSERDNWQLFDEFNPRNATSAFHELEWE